MRLTYKDKYGHWCSDGSKASLQLGNPRENWPSILWGDAVDKLAAYEDAEEQGLLVRLPCKVGETVWRVNFDKRRKRIEEIRFDVNLYNAFGRTIFLTREEAEAALKGEQDDGV